jgi:hypothetical protein
MNPYLRQMYIFHYTSERAVGTLFGTYMANILCNKPIKQLISNGHITLFISPLKLINRDDQVSSLAL